MYTLKLFSENLQYIPSHTAWYLSDIAEYKGKQDLFIQQSPQKLKVLREHALIESAVASNRIEGVEIDQKRVGTVVFGQPLLRDRDEEEVQGYRDALELIHQKYQELKPHEKTIKLIHKMSRGIIWDAGKYKEKDSNIIERQPSGETTIRFKTVPAKQTPEMMKKMVSSYAEIVKNNEVNILLVIAACNLDFLCIHPFRDGNGRVSRLLLLLQLYRSGYEVSKFISIERLIEEYKERYYETLQLSSQKWHQGKHDPWPYINFLLYIIKKAYAEFASRIEKMEMRKGSKTEIVIDQITKLPDGFTLSQLNSKCPDVSHDMIRKILKDLRNADKIKASGRGMGAKWFKKGNTL